MFTFEIVTFSDLIRILVSMILCKSGRKFYIIMAFISALGFTACKIERKAIKENNSENLVEYFKNPPKGAQPQAWWWWLQTPTNKEAITRDLEEMKAKGLSGCMILDGGVSNFGPNKWQKKTIIGETEIIYLDTDEYEGGTLDQPIETMETWSREWRNMVRFASLEAGRLGLDLGIFIGPAGCAAPWVTPSDGQQELVWNETSIEGGKYIHIKLSEPVQEKESNKRINELTQSAQLSNYQDVATLAVPIKTKINLQEVLDLSKKVDDQGNLKWDVPKGEWNIYRFGYRPTGRNLNGVFYIDHLSKEVFDKHWDHTVGLLLAEMNVKERSAFKYIECDSWEAGDPNWTKYFPNEFEDRRGYEIIKYLPVLAGNTIDSKEKSEHFKNDYRLTISDLIAENHYAKQREVANANDLLSYAEAAGPHQFQADILKCVGNCDVAMGEFWVPSPHRPTPPARFLVRDAATAAHIYGKKLVFAEAFTSVGPNWEQSPFLMKASADQAFCDGLNWICFHTFTHHPSVKDVPGLTHSAGTHFDRTITWWEQSTAFVEYLSRCSYMLQQGLFVADVLFYNGDGIKRNGLNKNLNAMISYDGLKNPPPELGKGYDYDKCNEDVLLSRLAVEDGSLVLPDGMNYRILALDKNSPVSLNALQKIVKLAEQGATIIGVAPIPMLGINDESGDYNDIVKRIWGSSDNGELKLGKGRIIWNKNIRDVLLQDKQLPDFECSGISEKGYIDYIHRRNDAADIYFISSRWQPVEKVVCTFRVSGKQPELWDPVSGEIRKITNFKEENGRTVIPLKFDPCGSYFIVFRNPVATNNIRLNWPDYDVVKQIGGPWLVKFDKEWGGPMSTIFQQLDDWRFNTNEGIKYYSGKATYTKSFFMPDSSINDSLEYFIDLGKVHELAEVRLNGENLGVLWTKPFKTQITSILKIGNNKLEIDVVNLWPNRLIGDEFLPENERYTKTNIRKFTTNTELLPSGLLGPVKIQLTSKVTLNN
jgi:hypothetical protein